MNFRRLMLFMIVTFVSAGSLHAQWVPVVAKIRMVHQTIVDGKLVRSETKEGDYYRSSDGSVLRHWKTVNGDEQAGGRGELLDNKNLASYQLNYHTKQAFQSEWKMAKPSPDVFRAEPPKSLGEDSIEGIRCTIVPAQFQDGFGQPPKDAGRTCVSTDYALTLRTDITVRQGTTIEHTLIEMFDLRMHQEPDAKLFDIEAQFTVFKPQTRKELPDIRP